MLIFQHSLIILSFLFFSQASRRKDSSDTREARTRRTKVSSIRKITRNGRTVEAEDGGSDAGEEAQPGTQGDHIVALSIFSLLFLCTSIFLTILKTYMCLYIYASTCLESLLLTYLLHTLTDVAFSLKEL